MSRHSSGWPQHRGLYTANDYIKAMLDVIEDNKNRIKQLEERNEELNQKMTILKKKNKDLMVRENHNKQIDSSLRESISGLKHYIKKLEVELKTRTQRTAEDMTLWVTESTAKHEMNASTLVIHNMFANKTFSLKCDSNQSDNTFIDLSQLKANRDLPKRFNALVIEWRFLPTTPIDGQNNRVLDISEWRIKDNTIVNLIPLEGYPLRPNSGQILKMAFNGIIDFNGFVRQTMTQSLASNTFTELEFQLKELKEYLKYINDSNPISENIFASKQSKPPIGEKSKRNDKSSDKSDPEKQLMASIPLWKRFESQTNCYESVKSDQNIGIRASNQMLRWRPGRADPSSMEVSDDLEHRFESCKL